MTDKTNVKALPVPSIISDIFGKKDDSFSMRIGGTFYEVSTHFDPNGKQTVLEQFEQLLLRHKFESQN